MTSGFPVQSGRQLGSPTLRHTDYCLHPVGRGFELPGVTILVFVSTNPNNSFIRLSGRQMHPEEP